MRMQAEKGRLFRELHQRPGILILPNPWDASTVFGLKIGRAHV